jgi:hypothetical protein
MYKTKKKSSLAIYIFAIFCVSSTQGANKVKEQCKLQVLEII